MTHHSRLFVLIAAAVLSLSGLAGSGRAADSLYGRGGIRAEAVKQGTLGSCYFHSVVAALALARPEHLRKMIQSNPDGTFTVQFADGKKENAYPDDLKYTRETGYDLSDGLWVAVLFRAYAQRVLRESLLKSLDKSDLFPLVKKYLSDFIATNDPLLIAYDRAIRSQVDQYGNVDRVRLQAKLKEEMAPVPVSAEIKDSFMNMLTMGGFFDSLAETIKQNGEIFGAYRAVGQGGLAEAVMHTLTGRVAFSLNETEEKAAGALAEGFTASWPLVACTAGSKFYQALAANQTLPAGADLWYVNAHCYTVTGYDPAQGRVQLRNPWARHPDPNGLFSLPLSLFVPGFRGIVTSGPESR